MYLHTVAVFLLWRGFAVHNCIAPRHNAERGGFEPPVPFQVRTPSKRGP